LAVIIGAAALSLPWLQRANPLLGTVRSDHRTEADLQALADRLPRGGGPPAKVFTRLEWANYLTWSAGCRASVFAEGRIELYPDDTWRRYLTVTQAGPGWEAVLDDYGVDFLLLDQTYHRSLLERVNQSTAWSRRASAGPAVLFARNKSGPGEATAPLSAPLPSAGVAASDF
jgi:hypothetical protein